jgi:nitroimidazol reductase NimA-like FMN-containing flavoprotein (pyridoxamine 5'-phosphate oxidase superfamily)
MLSGNEADFLLSERVARMATVDMASNLPHVVPVCFAFDGQNIYTTLHASSKRLKNMKEGSEVSLLVDKYVEENSEWKILRGLLIYGSAKILTYDESREEFMHGWRLLIEKYPQYKHWANPDLTPNDPNNRRIVKFRPSRVTRWGFS